ncbi:MAG TPA: isoprenylcysteine carboxylmethyltransferase family protein [Ktedonobacteraceae bacterium]|nr:isoprenylcysteine carboxylmethyltransferase family protein [Ktedonobacteraceae bacterium]
MFAKEKQKGSGRVMPLVYTNIVYASIFGGILLIWSTSELAGPARWHGNDGAKKRDRGSLLVATLSGLLGLLFFFLLPLLCPVTTITWRQPLVFCAGIVLILLGSSLRWYAISTLGRFFTGSVVIQAGQRVIQHGPYRYMRHPSYTGILVVVAGIGLMMTNWASLCSITLGLLVGLLYRISVEERVLKQELGQPYEEYMRHTRRLLPFIF